MRLTKPGVDLTMPGARVLALSFVIAVRNRLLLSCKIYMSAARFARRAGTREERFTPPLPILPDCAADRHRCPSAPPCDKPKAGPEAHRRSAPPPDAPSAR